ncbi:MAG TPA: FAD-dependent oxidoreductase [Planctomycetota bacterium]
MTAPPRVVVLGAGVAGLYAARILAEAGVDTLVLERAEVVGGLAAGRERGGNHYDFGVHLLHAQDPEVFGVLQAELGDLLRPVAKSAKIRYGRGFRRYPLRFLDVLAGIPLLELLHCLSGMAFQSVRNTLRPREPRDAEEALIQLYGGPLYRSFFRDFTAHHWGLPASALSATFVKQKMPRLSAVDGLKRVLGKLGLGKGQVGGVESALGDETLWYTERGCRSFGEALAAAVRRAGGRILLESPATGFRWGAAGVESVRYQAGGIDREVECDFLVSTIPLPHLVRAAEPAAPSAVQASAAALRFKPVAVYGLLVARPQVLDCLYVYFRNRIFHRVAEPTRSGLRVAQTGHTLLLAEITCDEGDSRWEGREDVRQQVVRDLVDEGLIEAAEVLEIHVFVNAHAYPMFSLGFESHLDGIRNWLGGFANLRSVGRNGGFCYPNMHGAMQMGAAAACDALAATRR